MLEISDERGVGLCGQARERSQALGRTGMDRLERGQDLRTQSVPRDRAVAVARVFATGQSTLGEVAAQLGAPHAEQRTQHPPAVEARPDRGEAGDSGAAHGAQQHRLGLVVQVVRGRDVRAAAPNSEFFVDESFAPDASDPSETLHAGMSTFPGGPVLLADSTNFLVPHTVLHVTKDIYANASVASGQSARATAIDQSFSQTIIPEPTSLVLSLVGLIGLIGYRRYR